MGYTRTMDQLKLPVSIDERTAVRRFSSNQVLKNLKKYSYDDNCTYSAKLEWQLGYVCALRDAELITYKVWGEAISVLHDRERRARAKV